MAQGILTLPADAWTKIYERFEVKAGGECRLLICSFLVGLCWSMATYKEPMLGHAEE